MLHLMQKVSASPCLKAVVHDPSYVSTSHTDSMSLYYDLTQGQLWSGQVFVA